MSEVIEIYRELDEDSAEELSGAASAVAQRLGLLGEYSTLKWPDNPRVGVAVICGDLATRIHESLIYEELQDIVMRGGNAEPLETALALVPRNLPFQPGNYVDKSLGGGVDIRDAVMPDNRRIANSNLWSKLNGAIGRIPQRREEHLQRLTRESIRTKRLMPIKFIGLDMKKPPLSESYLSRVVGPELKPLLPTMIQGPVQIRFTSGVDLGEITKQYGFLEKVDKRYG